jgi:hypothetical protein
MKLLLTLPAVVLLGVGATACGGVGKGPVSASQSSSNAAVAGSAVVRTASSATPVQPSPKKDSDGDGDNLTNSFYDTDDKAILAYGHAASAAEVQAVTAVVKRYYAAASAGDGATACSLIYSILAESIAEDYGRPPGPPALRGKTCAVVMSKLFKQRHQQLTADVFTLKVTGVRVDGKRGSALLSFRRMPDRHILVHRERGAWKIYTLLDAGLP